ncbi:MAG TPA: right-handed parallel beta-helix repeat-containing protein [Polyangia bacterium]|nr:right-handed parallel beta-helix repeat-containing protein [Polyangia bacterium]
MRRGALCVAGLGLLAGVGCANSGKPNGAASSNADANGTGGAGPGAKPDGGTGGAAASDAGGSDVIDAGVDVGVASILIVAPDGQGSDCSLSRPCALTTARDQARTLTQRNGPQTIRLRGGTYALSQTFQLVESDTAHDSGLPGSPTVYEAAAGETPVLSGGVVVTGWSLFDQAKGIYRAKVDPSLRTRQLYVGGVRATRARGPVRPAGFTLTDTGVTAPNTAFATYRAPTQLEAIFDAQWRTIRCGVASVAGANLTLDQPCWDNANVTKKSPGGGWPPSSLFWIENAYELLDEAGEWFLDETAGDLFYKPRPGEDLTTATVVVPVLEALVDARGTTDRPIHDVTFRGLTFAFSTWLRPSSAEGSANWQACYDVTGTNAVQPGFDAMTRMPSAVTLSAAHDFLIENSMITHVGAGALSIENGSSGNSVSVNRFEDVSGCGIQLGDLSIWSADTPASQRTSNNLVEKNVITQVGAEYHGAVGIFVGITENSSILHNELFDLSYTGISVGWGGWNKDYAFGGNGSHAGPTYAHGNRIIGNRIHDVVSMMIDGGGIYTQGPQPDSVIEENYIYNVGTRTWAIGIYLDEGTQSYHVDHNVLTHVHDDIVRCWNTATPNQNLNNVIEQNFADVDFYSLDGNVGRNNTLVNGALPADAQAIADASGPGK